MTLLTTLTKAYCKERGLKHPTMLEDDVRFSLQMLPSRPLNKHVRAVRDRYLRELRK